MPPVSSLTKAPWLVFSVCTADTSIAHKWLQHFDSVFTAVVGLIGLALVALLFATFMKQRRAKALDKEIAGSPQMLAAASEITN